MSELAENLSIIKSQLGNMLSDKEKMIFSRRLGLPVFNPSRKYMETMFRKFRLYLVLHAIESVITLDKKWILLNNDGTKFYGCTVCPFGQGRVCGLKGQEKITSNKHGDVEFEKYKTNFYRRCIEWVRYV